MLGLCCAFGFLAVCLMPSIPCMPYTCQHEQSNHIDLLIFFYIFIMNEILMDIYIYSNCIRFLVSMQLWSIFKYIYIDLMKLSPVLFLLLFWEFGNRY